MADHRSIRRFRRGGWGIAAAACGIYGAFVASSAALSLCLLALVFGVIGLYEGRRLKGLAVVGIACALLHGLTTRWYGNYFIIALIVGTGVIATLELVKMSSRKRDSQLPPPRLHQPEEDQPGAD